MSTPHIQANPGEIAKTVLMPGDPLRAKFISETFLQDARCINEVRGMLGYTGRYKGKPVTVMAHGMGIPSVGIYTWELFTHFGVDEIVRIGSAGSYTEEVKIFDVLLVTGAYSESSYAKTQNGYDKDINYPDATLTEKLRQSARRQGLSMPEGFVHSTDVFYQDSPEGQEPYWRTLRREKQTLAVEMETFGLFHNAAATGKAAAALVTISDNFTNPAQNITIEEREKHFATMIDVALGIL
ncbi:purine-nucleoside phosphorylase [Ruminococcaceae bacterium OttesenSCG-928-I18]|nr:purine-nucleoside phosphorylase [Ruminococcaceae bacterium OttesenSCG-928-I18]